MGRSLSVDKTVGAYPVFKADDTYVGVPSVLAASRDSHKVGGFSNNGDYIILPTSTSGLIGYYDSTGTQITTSAWGGGLTLAELHANCDHWVGFMLDATDNLLYVCAVDLGTTPDTFYFASISAAGSLTNIGNAQVTTDFATATNFNSAGSGASALYRTADGTGNLFIRTLVGAGVEQAEFNISTGALVTDTATILGNIDGVPYKTEIGNYIRGCSYSATNGTTAVYVSGKSDAYIHAGHELGMPSAQIQLYLLQWGGRIVSATATATSVIFGPRAFTVAEFDSKVDELARALGVSV